MEKIIKVIIITIGEKMNFQRFDEDGNIYRKRVVVDCSEDTPRTEQSHKEEVNINNIVKRHGIDLVQKTAMLQSADYQFDDIPGNDFAEAMIKVTKAQQTFDSMPSQLRKKFNNSPAEFLDYIQDKNNIDSLVEMGLAQREQINQPVNVNVVNNQTAETPT